VKKVFILLMVVIIIFGMAACSSKEEKETIDIESKIIERVKAYAYLEGYYGSIGGNEIKTTNAEVTDISQISDTEYLVRGRITMIDVYGTQWSNLFDINMTAEIVDNEGQEEVEISGGDFIYKSESWTKG